jgi:hypothetical protein
LYGDGQFVMKIAIGEITDRGIKAVIRRRGGKLKTFLASE